MANRQVPDVETSKSIGKAAISSLFALAADSGSGSWKASGGEAPLLRTYRDCHRPS